LNGNLFEGGGGRQGGRGRRDSFTLRFHLRGTVVRQGYAAAEQRGSDHGNQNKDRKAYPIFCIPILHKLTLISIPLNSVQIRVASAA
jgi:hypothetical protein